MTNLYLLINGEQKGPYSEDQVRSMYLAGTITSDVHYWQEGQAEWLPIDGLFSAQIVKEISVPVPRPTPQQSPRIVGQSASPRVIEFSMPIETPKSKAFLIWIVIGLIILAAFGYFVFHATKIQGSFKNVTVMPNFDPNLGDLITTSIYDFNNDGTVNESLTAHFSLSDEPDKKVGYYKDTYSISGNLVTIVSPNGSSETMTIQGDSLIRTTKDNTQHRFERQ